MVVFNDGGMRCVDINMCIDAAYGWIKESGWTI